MASTIFRQQISVDRNWFTAFWRNEFSFGELGKKLLTGKAGSEYNPPLWTLKIELIGSFMVFGLLLLINPYHFFIRCTVLIIALIYFHGTFYDGFIWGMLLADTIKNIPRTNLSATTSSIGLLVVVVLAAMPYYALEETFTYSSQNSGLIEQGYHHVPMLSAVLLLSLVLFSSSLQKLLTKRWLLWLGELSYALYAIHLLIIGSVVAYVVTHLVPNVGYGMATLAGLVIYLVTLTVVSHLIVKGIDDPSVKLANYSGHIAVKLLNRVLPDKKLD